MSSLHDFLMSSYLNHIHTVQKTNKKKYCYSDKKYKKINYFEKVVVPIKMRHYFKHKKELESKKFK